MLTFGNKINRRYSLNLSFLNTYATINVHYHKNNSFVGIDLEHDFSKFINEKEDLHYNLFTDIQESIFVNTFLNIINLSCNNLDIKNQFNGIKDEWSHKIFYITNESINLQIIKDEKKHKDFHSMLYIFAFTIEDMTDEFIFLLAERQHIDKISNKKIVRSCGSQLSTKKSLAYLNEYKSNKNSTNNKNLLDIKVI